MLAGFPARLRRSAAACALGLISASCGARSELSVLDTNRARPAPAPNCEASSFARTLGKAGNLYLHRDDREQLLLWGDGYAFDDSLTGSVVAELDAQGQPRWRLNLPWDNFQLGGVALTDAGSLVVGGRFAGTISAGSAQLSSPPDGGVLVMKLDHQQNVVWSKSIGQTGRSYRGGVAVDQAGNVLLEGLFAGTLDFGPSRSGTREPLSSDPGGCLETFVAKLDADGFYLWAKRFAHGGLCLDSTAYLTPAPGGPLAFAPDGSALVAAFGHGGDDEAGPQIDDPFLLKLDPNGNLLWQARYPGLAVDDLSVAANGQISLSARVSWFDLTLGSLVLPTRGGWSDWVIATLSKDGRPLRARRFSAAETNTFGRAAFDPLGNVWALVATSRTQIPATAVDLGGFSLPPGSKNDLFLLGLDPDWNVRKAAHFSVNPTPGSSNANASALGIAVDDCYNGSFTGAVAGSVDFGSGQALSASETLGRAFLAGQRLSY